MGTYVGIENQLNAFGSNPAAVWQELDQTLPLGRWRTIASGGDLIWQENTDAVTPFDTVQEWLRFDQSAQEIILGVPIIFTAGGILIPDDDLLQLGTGGDQVMLNRSTPLAANTPLTDVLVGTPVTTLVPANSLMVSNITASGDQIFYGNTGGNSQEWLRYDSSAGSIIFNEASADINFRVESNNNTAMLVIDGGQDNIGLGTTVVTQSFVAIQGLNVARALVTGFGWELHHASGTMNDSGGAATIANVARVYYDISTHTGDAARTYTAAATVMIAGAPVASTNITITNAYSLAVLAGTSLFGGTLRVADDTPQYWGNGLDGTIAFRTTTLGAFTAYAGVLAGAPGSAASPADTLFIVNQATGDMVFFVTPAADSQEWLRFDTSASLVVWNESGVVPLDHRWEGAGDANLLNINWGNSVVAIGSAISATYKLSVTGAAQRLTGANSTTNTTFLVENSTNTAVAAHSIVDVTVGGTTSVGDPQLRLTIPSGTSWHIGVDNSEATDALFIGTGTAIGTNGIIRVSSTTSQADNSITTPFLYSPVSKTYTGAVSAGNAIREMLWNTVTRTFSDATTRTGLQTYMSMAAMTLAQSGGAMTLSAAAAIGAVNPTAGASVTLTHSSAFRAVTGGAAVNVSGVYVEAQTAGTTGNYGLLIANGFGSSPSLADHAGIACVDLSAGNASLAFSTEHAVAASAATPSTHKWGVQINGATYYILLSNV